MPGYEYVYRKTCRKRKSRPNEVLSITIGESESAKFWLSVLNELKNRGVQDIFILCSDGLNGLKEAITAAYLQAEHQRCIVHKVRNTLKYVANKDMASFASDLKTIYHAPDEQTALARLDEVRDRVHAGGEVFRPARPAQPAMRAVGAADTGSESDNALV